MKTPKNLNAPRIFTTYDIGRMTGTDPTTVHKWIDRGLLRGYRTPGGHRRVRAEDLRSFLVEHQMPLPQELGGRDTLRTMVVDSDPSSLKALARSLKRLRPEWEMQPFDNGVDALLALPVAIPDVVVLDLALSDMDSLAVCRQLRERADAAGVKVVAVAAELTERLEREALASGVACCLGKPVSGPDLIEAIERAAGVHPAACA
jgi:excisionase family DNA binding protein